jgi:hypothetical protein
MRARIIATAVAAAALLPLSLTTAAVASPAASHDVLTISKVGGANVKVGAVLKANLAPKTKVVFVAGSITVTCKASSFTSKVKSNPKKPGTAKETLTGQSISKCAASSAGTTVKSVKLAKLNLATTVSDKKGFPVTVTGASTTVVVSVSGIGTLTCTYGAKTVTGHASNKSQSISFSKVKLAFQKGSSLCSLNAKTATFTATYGPVVDSSVKGNPKVFVN